MFAKKKKEEETEMTFLQHLEELRWHIIRSFIAVFTGAVLAFLYKKIIFDQVILAPNQPGFITNRLLCRLSEITHAPALCINQTPIELISIKMSGQFTTHINISLVAGIIIAFPYIFWEFWNFFKPALYEKERKHARGAVLSASFLFLLGVVFGYFVIVPLSLNFLGSYRVSDIVHNQINVRSYIGTISSIVLAAGLAFELPVIAYFLARIGIITPGFMRKYRKHSIIVILIIAAVITPPDVFSQTLVAIPLLILYEISILIVAGVIRKRKLNDELRESETVSSN
jgi:sec-independent protein translocase protein TatC